MLTTLQIHAARLSLAGITLPWVTTKTRRRPRRISSRAMDIAGSLQGILESFRKMDVLKLLVINGCFFQTVTELMRYDASNIITIPESLYKL